MLIEATTRINYEAYREYYLFNFLQGKRSPWQTRILFALAPLLALVFLVLYLLDPSDLVNLAGLVIMLVMGLLLALIILIIPRRYYKSVEKTLMIPNHYIFDDEQVAVSPEHDPSGDYSGEHSGDSSSEPVVFKYQTLLKVYETGDYFFLFLSRSQSCIVGKQDITVGTAAGLRDLLSARLGERYLTTRSARKASVTENK